MIFVSGAVSGIEGDNRRAFEYVRRKAMEAFPSDEVVIPHDIVPEGSEWRDALPGDVPCCECRRGKLDFLERSAE